MARRKASSSESFLQMLTESTFMASDEPTGQSIAAQSTMSYHTPVPPDEDGESAPSQSEEESGSEEESEAEEDSEAEEESESEADSESREQDEELRNGGDGEDKAEEARLARKIAVRAARRKTWTDDINKALSRDGCAISSAWAHPRGSPNWSLLTPEERHGAHREAMLAKIDARKKDGEHISCRYEAFKDYVPRFVNRGRDARPPYPRDEPKWQAIDKQISLLEERADKEELEGGKERDPESVGSEMIAPVAPASSYRTSSSLEEDQQSSDDEGGEDEEDGDDEANEDVIQDEEDQKDPIEGDHERRPDSPEAARSLNPTDFHARRNGNEQAHDNVNTANCAARVKASVSDKTNSAAISHQRRRIAREADYAKWRKEIMTALKTDRTVMYKAKKDTRAKCTKWDSFTEEQRRTKLKDVCLAKIQERIDHGKYVSCKYPVFSGYTPPAALGDDFGVDARTSQKRLVDQQLKLLAEKANEEVSEDEEDLPVFKAEDHAAASETATPTIQLKEAVRQSRQPSSSSLSDLESIDDEAIKTEHATQTINRLFGSEPTSVARSREASRQIDKIESKDEEQEEEATLVPAIAMRRGLSIGKVLRKPLGFKSRASSTKPATPGAVTRGRPSGEVHVAAGPAHWVAMKGWVRRSSLSSGNLLTKRSPDVELEGRESKKVKLSTEVA